MIGELIGGYSNKNVGKNDEKPIQECGLFVDDYEYIPYILAAIPGNVLTYMVGIDQFLFQQKTLKNLINFM